MHRLLFTRSVVSNSFVTPQTTAQQAPLTMGFFQQEYQRGLPFPSPGDVPHPGIEPKSPALQADSSPLSHWGKPNWCQTLCKCLRLRTLHLKSVQSAKLLSNNGSGEKMKKANTKNPQKTILTACNISQNLLQENCTAFANINLL